MIAYRTSRNVVNW